MINTSAHNGDLQAAINAALATNDNVYVDKVAPLLTPVFISNFDGVKYNQVTISIIGDAKKGDNGKRSVINAKFNDAPILSIQEGKGCEIKGLNIQGPSIGRDSRYSPQAGIAIDPVCYLRPVDGGYPNLEYKGDTSRGGSTAITIEHCTTNNTTVGVITSPNGYTQNADCISVINHRFGNHKYGLAGCQDQEKNNLVRDFQAWGKVDVLFQFNKYGAQKPGHWVIDGGNVAGNVKSLIFRESHGWFPLYMSNIYAESIKEIGFWGTLLSDKMENCSINFDQGYYPSAHLSGGGITLQNNSIRYYGNKNRTLVFVHAYPFIEVNNKIENDVLRLQKDTKHSEVTISATATPREGQTIVFYHPSNYSFLGSGVQVSGVLKSDDFDQSAQHRKGFYNKSTTPQP